MPAQDSAAIAPTIEPVRLSATSGTGALQRSLGLGSLTFYGVGVILGAGIYSILGEAAGVAGEALWWSFLLASLAALLTGLSYAESVSSVRWQTARTGRRQPWNGNEAVRFLRVSDHHIQDRPPVTDHSPRLSIGAPNNSGR